MGPGVGPEEGPGEGPREGPGESPGAGPGEGPGVGPGGGPQEGPGLGPGVGPGVVHGKIQDWFQKRSGGRFVGRSRGQGRVHERTKLHSLVHPWILCGPTLDTTNLTHHDFVSKQNIVENCFPMDVPLKKSQNFPRAKNIVVEKILRISQTGKSAPVKYHADVLKSTFNWRSLTFATLMHRFSVNPAKVDV